MSPSCPLHVGGMAGFFTAVGGQLPAYMDALAGWLVKLQPVVHGYLLQVGG